MVGIQIVSHGLFSKGLVDSLDMILGDTTGITYNTLGRESDLESFRGVVLESTQQLMNENGVIVFVDMFGATPYNAALYNSQYFTADEYAVIAGFNLPLLIEAVMNREHLSVTELVAHIKSIASDTIIVGEI